VQIGKCKSKNANANANANLKMQSANCKLKNAKCKLKNGFFELHITKVLNFTALKFGTSHFRSSPH
jgi:hypothetical protein